MMTVKLIRPAAWLLLAAIIFVTISPIGLRPHTITSVELDRMMAYVLTGLAFTLAYPKSVRIVALLLIVGAGGIELLQYLSPSRHPHLTDASVKAFGAAIGIITGWLANRLLRTPN